MSASLRRSFAVSLKTTKPVVTNSLFTSLRQTTQFKVHALDNSPLLLGCRRIAATITYISSISPICTSTSALSIDNNAKNHSAIPTSSSSLGSHRVACINARIKDAVAFSPSSPAPITATFTLFTVSFVGTALIANCFDLSTTLAEHALLNTDGLVSKYLASRLENRVFRSR